VTVVQAAALKEPLAMLGEPDKTGWVNKVSNFFG